MSRIGILGFSAMVTAAAFCHAQGRVDAGAVPPAPPYLAEGEMAVVRPRGADFEVVARVRVEEWASLVAAAKKK